MSNFFYTTAPNIQQNEPAFPTICTCSHTLSTSSHSKQYLKPVASSALYYHNNLQRQTYPVVNFANLTPGLTQPHPSNAVYQLATFAPYHHEHYPQPPGVNCVLVFAGGNNDAVHHSAVMPEHPGFKPIDPVLWQSFQHASVPSNVSNRHDNVMVYAQDEGLAQPSACPQHVIDHPMHLPTQQAIAYNAGDAISSPTSPASGGPTLSTVQSDDFSRRTSFSAASFRAPSHSSSREFRSGSTSHSVFQPSLSQLAPSHVSSDGLTICAPDVDVVSHTPPSSPDSVASLSVLPSYSDEDCDALMANVVTSMLGDKGSPTVTRDSRLGRPARRQVTLAPKHSSLECNSGVPFHTRAYSNSSTLSNGQDKRIIERVPCQVRAQQTYRLSCDLCPKTFRGAPELDRHVEHTHRRSMVWVCVNDPDKPKYYLPGGCKACEVDKKEYTRGDNAASHMRRVHLNPKDPTKGNQNRGGMSGGGDPPLSVLKADGVVVEQRPRPPNTDEESSHKPKKARTRHDQQYVLTSNRESRMPATSSTRAGAAYDFGSGIDYIPRSMRERCPWAEDQSILDHSHFNRVVDSETSVDDSVNVAYTSIRPDSSYESVYDTDSIMTHW